MCVCIALYVFIPTEEGASTVVLLPLLCCFFELEEMANVIDVTMPYRLIKEEIDSSPSSPERESSPVDAVLFVGMSLVLGIASRHLLRGTRVPYTVALLVIGIALGSLGSISIVPFCSLNSIC